MKRIAMIRNGAVENVAVWDGVNPWSPVGYALVDITDRPDIGPGCGYENGVFTAPTEPLNEE